MIFVDTGPFVARYFSRDQYHQRARALWHEIARSAVRCLTSNFVLDETFTLLARRAGYGFAAQRGRIIYSSRILGILRPTLEDELEAIDDFERFADQGVSFTDCVSFALMRRNRLRQVFSFDRHFELAGFEPWPRTRTD